MKLLSIAVLASVLLLSTGCVTKGTHELTLQELNVTKHELSDARSTIAQQEDEIARNREAIESNKVEMGLQHDELAMLSMKRAQLQADLNQSQAQLATMRQIEAETQKRNEIYARFVKELQKMIDGGQLTVTIEKGRIVINLPNEILFATGHSSLNEQGQEAIRQLAKVFSEFADRRFQVEGYTDNVPIKSDRYPSNWELSTARALSVVHLMIEEGVSPENVSAAGFGEFHPRADNDTPEGRALNRRIEIVMLPNLDILSSELPKVAE